MRFEKLNRDKWAGGACAQIDLLWFRLVWRCVASNALALSIWWRNGMNLAMAEWSAPSAHFPQQTAQILSWSELRTESKLRNDSLANSLHTNEQQNEMFHFLHPTNPLMQPKKRTFKWKSRLCWWQLMCWQNEMFWNEEKMLALP